MKIRHLFVLGLWAIASTTGGVFVADRRVVVDALATPQRITTGTPLRLGVLLTETPISHDRNQAMIQALYRLQEQANRCGGINQAPMFWVIETPTPIPVHQATGSSALTVSQSDDVETVIDQEAIAMKTLIREKGIHGAIAVFTPQANSEALRSDALNLAVESRLPVISPLNTETIVVSEGRGDLFRLDRGKLFLRKKIDYWARTIPNDRQHLSAIAQLTRQKSWNRIATIAPDTPRGRHLEQIFTHVLTPLGGTTIQPTRPIRYTLTPTSPASSALPASSASPASPSLSINLGPLASQSPDAILLILNSTHRLESLQQLMDRLSETTDLNQVPVILDRWVDVDNLLQQSHAMPLLTVDSGDSVKSPQETPLAVQESQSQFQFQDPPQSQSVLTDGQTSPLQDRFHKLKGIWGLAPGPQTSNWQGFNPNHLHSNPPSSPAISYIQDAATLMILAAEAAGSNSKYGIQAELRNVANPPGIEVTDLCQGLEHLRQGDSINYQGKSGQVDLGGWGNVNQVQHYGVWQIDEKGDRQMIEPLHWSPP